MVLCAGLGTRLRPLTLELPKPMVPVGDRPLFAHIAAALQGAGFSELVINTHHLPEAFANVGEEFGIELQAVHEPVIRGTAGGVAGVRERFGAPPVLVWNGDIWVEPPITELLAAAGDGLALAVRVRPRGQGTVGLDANGHVVRLRGESFDDEHSGGDYVGVLALGARVLAALPSEGCLIGDVALPELRAGRGVRSVAIQGDFHDAGGPDEYLELNLRWLAGRSHWCGPGAEVGSGVELDRALLGAGARVVGQGRLSRVVAWPGAVVEAPLADAIVTGGGRVVRVHSR